MNLLQTLWGWLASLFGKTPATALPPTESEGECCDEECCEETECGPDDDCCDEGECAPEDECCDHEDSEPEEELAIAEEIEEAEEIQEVKEESAPPVAEQQSATAEQLITELFLSKGVSEKAIEKYEIAKNFSKWYEGELNADSVLESIPSFKVAAPTCWISPKINRAFEE